MIDTTRTILQGNASDVLKTLPDKSVQCCITSPPYFGLRDYGTGKWVGGDPNCPHRRMSKYSEKTTTGHAQEELRGNVGDAIYKTVCPLCGAVREDNQIGLEETPEQYIQRLVDVFRDVRRVLKDDGTLWVNIGDSYAGGQGRWGGISDIADKQYSNSGSIGQIGKTKKWEHDVIKNKDLIGIPWMLAFALRDDGWYLRNDIIWHKPNPMPESVKDRCTKSHEYIFLLTKSPKYYFDYEAIQEEATGYDGRKDTMLKGSKKYEDNSYLPNGSNSQTMASRGHERWKFKNIENQSQQSSVFDVESDVIAPVRNKRDVWTVATKPYSGAHFATFPEALIAPCILAGTKKGDTVLDPFNGSGTTGVVCMKNERNYIGTELNPEYIELSLNRFKEEEETCYMELNQYSMFSDDWG